MKKLIKYLSVVGLTLIIAMFIKGDTNIMDSSPLFRVGIVLFATILMITTAIITEDLKH